MDKREEKQPQQEMKELTTDDLQYGYIVGLAKTGEFVFETLGESPGLVELLGIHKYASHRVETIKNVNQGADWPILVKQLSEIIKTMQGLITLTTQQAATNQEIRASLEGIRSLVETKPEPTVKTKSE